jgi:CRP-like cAMP-binding protein/predicted acylesterase/phospholipase RssA
MGTTSERTDAADAMDQLSAALGGVEAGPLAALRSEVEVQVLAPGAILFHEGDASDALYVVVRGELRATVANSQRVEMFIGLIGPGEPVGEMQILSGGTRTATVTATTETELARVPRLAMERLVRDTPDTMRQLTDAIRRRARRNQLASILPSLFGALDELMFREVEASVAWVALPRGTTLFEQGEPGEHAYILVNGRLQASVRNSAGGEKVVGEILRGEIVGEMAIVTGEPRSARVRALRDSELVSLHRSAFERLIARHPQMLMALTRLVIERLSRAQSGTRPETPARSFAVIAGGPDVPLAEFTRRLAAALGDLGATLHIGAADLDRHLGTPGLAQTSLDDPGGARIASWIDEQEIRHRFVILEADTDASAWTVRCVRQADRLLVVGRAGDDPTPGTAERALVGLDGASSDVPTSLVLLHPPETMLPSGTKRWLEGRRLLRHHHVRDGNQADVARVARFMAGCAVGVALSGGGARGFAHVGVLEALKEARIPVDMIGGTSVGAVIAAESALGWDAATMARQNQAIFSGWRSDLTFPVLSILGGRRSGIRLKAIMGDVQIEDLWLPCFCVSSNLSRAEMMVHRAGSLWMSLRASASLPGILPPVVFEGDLLVDGALLCNLPADVMRELTGGGTTIAVDVSAELDMQHDYPYEDAISGWRILWSRLSGFSRASIVPSMAAVLQRSAELASVVMQREALLSGIDLYIRVPVQQFGLLDFDKAAEIIATGRRVARESLAGWQRAAREGLRPGGSP